MNHLTTYKLFEKTIGSEAIRAKHYISVPKKSFYKIFKIDPTSVRKKDFSKPGRYFKWLMREYKFGRLTEKLINDEGYSNKLNYYLFIFSTGWFKNKVKKQKKYEVPAPEVNLDIFKYKLDDFIEKIESYKKKYELETDKAKFDTVYSDSKIDILVPLNFTASYQTAKNTDWCSQSIIGFSQWNRVSIMFRIIPKDKSYDKLKLTWTKENGYWYISCSKYPEIRGDGSPFDIKDGDELWNIKLKEFNKVYNDESNPNKWKENSENIEKTMSLVSKEAKKYIEDYYKNHLNK
jgi:hypothetical protein